MDRHGSLFFFLAFFLQHFHTSIGFGGSSLPTPVEQWQPMQCDAASFNPSCSSYLYVTPGGRNLSQIASDFNGTASLTQPIRRLSGSEDLLVHVPCMCESINNTMNSFFHDTEYKGDQNDSVAINNDKFSGLAWNITARANERIVVHLLCGCSSTAPEGVLSYTVQSGDTLSNIATLFRSGSKEILSLNPGVTNPDFLSPGWILFVPMGVAGSSNKSESLLLFNYVFCLHP
jgi:hypothetical protein